MAHSNEIKQNEQILQTAKQNVERYRQGQAQIRLQNPAGEPLKEVEVLVVQKSQDFLFGNLAFDLVRSDAYYPDVFKKRFLELFNLAIFPFYWSQYEPKPGMVEWQRFIPVLEWCLAHGVTPKGHPLVWPYSAGVPEWLYGMPEGSVELLIQARVLDIVKGFEEFIHIWDVTNEAVNHISWKEATHPDFRSRYHEQSLWRGIPVNGAFKREIPIPEAADWVEKAFRWAYTANPRATLILNDYNQEIEPNVRQRFYELVKELQRRDTPVSGLGLQVHPLNHWLWPQQAWETLDLYAELNIPIHITELHQPSWEQAIEGGWREGTWSEAAQAEYIEQLYRLFYGHPAVVSINYWGLSDRDIWIEKGGLVDDGYHPKPVFNALKKLIKGEWMTGPSAMRTDDNGEVGFRGFFGEYEIIIRQPGKKHIALNFHLSQNSANRPVFVLPID
ncbi:MAG: endo-1,4-beta-xylanase [Omnitrophica WOR_2 bacterium]